MGNCRLSTVFLPQLREWIQEIRLDGANRCRGRVVPSVPVLRTMYPPLLLEK